MYIILLNKPKKKERIHVIVVRWARVVCLICTPEARGLQALRLRVYISGKPRVHMLQLLCTHGPFYCQALSSS